DYSFGLAFDTSGNLFVGNASLGSIVKFTSGSPSTFASGLNSPFGLAFDRSGDLFVAGVSSGIYEFVNTGTLSSTPIAFDSSLGYVNSLAFDGNGDLFATKYDNSLNTSSILEFNNTGTLSSTPTTFASGLGGKASLAFEPTATPEPSSFVLTGSGILALLTVRKFRRHTA
ncbi:MAG TPA: PEP-CTERM sorting domain-containing protein, partial [Verrucomicrobiae bacterium]